MAESTTSSEQQSAKLHKINLQKGWPNASLLPTAQVREASQKALSDPSTWEIGLNYGCEPMTGFTPLREQIARWLIEFYQHPTSESIEATNNGHNINGANNEKAVPDAARIAISGGASQNLACALQVYSDPYITTVWMVAPCYFLACNIFKDSGLKLRAVPEQNGESCDGIDLEWLERGLEEGSDKGADVQPLKYIKPWGKYYKNIVYCVPTFSNPSGKTMSLSTRQALVRLARKYDALIITDDVYDQLQWHTESDKPANHIRAPVARLIDIDRTLHPVPGPDDFGNTMSNGSFSKIVAPGVRTGWAEGTPKLIYGLSQCGSTASGGAPSHATATFIYEMLKSHTLQDYIKDVLCPSYQKRYSIMLTAIKKYLLPLGVTVGETEFGEEKLFGGYFIWLKLPDGLDADALTKTSASEWELILSPGSAFEVSGDNEHHQVRFRNEIRLSFAWEGEDELSKGVQRLGEVIKSMTESV